MFLASGMKKAVKNSLPRRLYLYSGCQQEYEVNTAARPRGSGGSCMALLEGALFAGDQRDSLSPGRAQGRLRCEGRDFGVFTFKRK